MLLFVSETVEPRHEFVSEERVRGFRATYIFARPSLSSLCSIGSGVHQREHLFENVLVLGSEQLGEGRPILSFALHVQKIGPSTAALLTATGGNRFYTLCQALPAETNRSTRPEAGNARWFQPDQA